MTRRTIRLLLVLALAAPLTEALADDDRNRKCSLRNDSMPSSRGATDRG